VEKEAKCGVSKIWKSYAENFDFEEEHEER
jgi:hypothetical protein